MFDISFKTKTVTIIDLSEPNTLRHQITTVSLTFFPTALGQYSGDMVYVSGEGECDSSGHQTIFSQSIGSVHCTKEGDLWCLSSFTKVIVTKRNCSLPLSSVAFVSSEFPCILVDDRPSTNDIWCYRADISQQSGKRLIGSFDKNRADFITFPKSNDEFYMQYKYKTIKSNPKYQTFSVITETGNTTKMSSPNCPMIGPGVFTCPQFVVLGHEMAEIALTPPQVLLVGDDRIIAYATDKGVKVYSPTFPSGVLLLNSTNVCTDLKISNSIHILDKGNRIIVAMCDKVKSSGYFQIYILYKGNYELSERSGDDCISLNMGQVINAFSPGNIEISVRHLLHPTKETVTVNDSPSSNLSLLGVLVILVLLVIILIPSLIYLVKKVRQRKSKKYQNFTTVRTTEDECETDVESHRDDDNDDIDDFPKPKGSSPTINNHVYDNEDPVISVFPNRHVVTVHFEQPTSLQNKDPGSPKPIDNSNSVCTGSGNVNPAHLICVSDPAAAVNNQVIPIPEDSLMNDQTSTFSQLLDDSPRNQILSSNVHLSFGPLSNPLHPSSSQFLSNQGRPRSQSAPNQDYLSHQSAPNQSLIRSQSLLHDEQHPPPQSTANRDHPPPQSTANRDRPPPQSTANRDHPPPQSTTNRDHPPPQSTANRDHPSTQSTTNRDHPSTQSTASQDWPLSQSATGKGLEIKYEEFVPLKPIKWIKQKTQEGKHAFVYMYRKYTHT